LQNGQQCWALWAFLAACPCTLFIDIICLFINWANKDACMLATGGTWTQTVELEVWWGSCWVFTSTQQSTSFTTGV